MEEITTTDLAQFGYRELAMAGDLLKAYAEHGLDGFLHDEVRVMMNKNSGNVFLTNSEFQVAMLTSEGKLEQWYSCPECGHEGFADEMEHEGNAECMEYVTSLTKEVA